MKKTYSAVIILAIIGTHNLAMQLVPSSPWQMLTPGNVKKIMACSDKERSMGSNTNAHRTRNVRYG